MTLRRFKDVIRDDDVRSSRSALREDIYGADISDVKVVALASDAPSGEREIGIAEFVRSVRAMSDGENVIMTAIAY
jgi:hypothetical protein